MNHESPSSSTPGSDGPPPSQPQIPSADVATCVAQLDDANAARILEIVTAAVGPASAPDISRDAALAEALAEAFALDAGAAPAASPGDVAREALLLLALDPATAAQIMAMAENRVEFKSAGLVTSVAVLTAAIIVLKTHVRIERDKDGKWTVLIDKPSVSDQLLKPLVRKLVSLFSGH